MSRRATWATICAFTRATSIWPKTISDRTSTRCISLYQVLPLAFSLSTLPLSYTLDPDNLFVKSMPILTAIYNRSIEIACRSSSSQSKVSLFRVDSTTGKRIELQYVLANEPDDSSAAHLSRRPTLVEFNPKRGFFLPSITDDRFICRAELPEASKTSEHVLIIQYTSRLNWIAKLVCMIGAHFCWTLFLDGIEYATKPQIHPIHYANAFEGKWEQLIFTCKHRVEIKSWNLNYADLRICLLRNDFKQSILFGCFRSQFWTIMSSGESTNESHLHEVETTQPDMFRGYSQCICHHFLTTFTL